MFLGVEGQQQKEKRHFRALHACTSTSTATFSLPEVLVLGQHSSSFYPSPSLSAPDSELEKIYFCE